MLLRWIGILFLVIVAALVVLPCHVTAPASTIATITASATIQAFALGAGIVVLPRDIVVRYGR
jgi:hypothetical protein